MQRIMIAIRTFAIQRQGIVQPSQIPFTKIFMRTCLPTSQHLSIKAAFQACHAAKDPASTIHALVTHRADNILRCG